MPKIRSKWIKCVECPDNNECDNGQTMDPSKGCFEGSAYEPTVDLKSMVDTAYVSEEEFHESS